MLKPLKERLTADPAATLALVRRLFADYGRRHLKGFAGAVVMMAIAAGCTALAAAAAGWVVNQAYVYRDFRGLMLLSAGLVAIFAIKGLASYGQAVSLAYVGNRITAENQRRIFDKLLTEGVTYFADRHSTDFIARMGYAANAPATVLTLLVTAFARDLLSVAALATVMVWEDPMLSLIALVVAPPAMYFLGKLIKRVRQIAKTQFEGGKRIVETLQETIQGFRVIKAFNLEEAMRERVYQDVRIVEQAANKLARTSNRSSPLMETLGGIIIAAAVLYTGYRVLETSAAPGAFTAFTTAFLLAYEPAKRLARLNIDLNTALYGVQVLFQLLDSPAGEKADGDKPALAFDRGRIEFDDVRFGYREGVSVLRATSFVAEPGQVTALVGPSGGGKSTIFNLLLRLYDADGGAIRIDGQEIAAVTRESVRRKIAYVGQDVFLFRGSFRENIAYGRPGATEEEIVAAAKAAFAHDFIAAGPEGYDSQVGEHGLQLSGGQRQRVSVARALIKDTPIVLLDEPTASLDSEAERHVQNAIARLCQGRTTLVIAHRLHTITHADRILVVEDGRIVESGRHEELLARGGRYADVFRMQFRKELEPADMAESDPRASTRSA